MKTVKKEYQKKKEENETEGTEIQKRVKREIKGVENEEKERE